MALPKGEIKSIWLPAKIKAACARLDGVALVDESDDSAGGLI